MKVILVRHCSATGQAPEAELTIGGREQAQILAEFLANHDVRRIISSPYLRAIQSAQPLARRLDLTVETETRLIERNLGKIEGSDWISPLKRSFEDFDICLPDGESTRSAMTRGREVIDEVLTEGDSAAIFTHGNLLSLIVKSFDDQLGFEFWQGLTNPDVFQLEGSAGRFEVVRIWK